MLAHLFNRHHSIPMLEKLLLGFSLVMGLLMVFIVPPFQKPDEATHFYKAVSIASGTLVCHKTSAGVFANPIPQYLAEFPKAALAAHVASDAHVVFPKNVYATLLTERSFDRSPVNEPSSCSL